MPHPCCAVAWKWLKSTGELRSPGKLKHAPPVMQNGRHTPTVYNWGDVQGVGSMQSRRNFIGHVATGLAGTLAAGNALGAGQRVRLGIIGPGARGTEILQQALACENVECIGAADVYTRRLEDVKKIAPHAKTYLDYRHLLDDQDIDAVLIATPQHLHAEHFTAAIASGKHVYQEKTMAIVE